MEKVSVIMSTFNEDISWVRKAIDSIIHQSYKNIEFIIILDNPNNIELQYALNQYAQNDDRIRLIINKSNIGLIASLNKGLRACTGKYIARMDADDISDRNRIEKQVKVLEEDNSIDFVSSLMIRIDEKDNIISKDSYVKTKTKTRQAISYYFPHPTWMFRRNVLDELKEYKNVECAEDYDFTSRALINGFELYVINEYLLKYRVRQNGISIQNGLKQKINSSIIRTSYRKALILKKEYNPYNVTRLNKINEKTNINYQVADKIYKNSINKNKLKKISEYIRICFISKEYFKYNILQGRIINRILKKIFLRENFN